MVRGVDQVMRWNCRSVRRVGVSNFQSRRATCNDSLRGVEEIPAEDERVSTGWKYSELDVVQDAVDKDACCTQTGRMHGFFISSTERRTAVRSAHFTKMGTQSRTDDGNSGAGVNQCVYNTAFNINS